MIASDGKLRKVCRNYEQVENYEKAVADEELWDLHHRREIDEMKSKQQLIDEERYYDVEPSDLIFLTHADHAALHGKYREVTEETRKKRSESLILKYSKEPHHSTGKHHSEETKKKMSEAQLGEKNHMFGKHLSENARNKISKVNKGKQRSEETKTKMSKASVERNSGRFWWNNGTYNKFSKECPGEGFVRGMLKFNK